jgi:hypothetical protein
MNDFAAELANGIVEPAGLPESAVERPVEIGIALSRVAHDPEDPVFDGLVVHVLDDMQELDLAQEVSNSLRARFSPRSTAA